ncbi:MAG TPA: M48 family metalloprotease [Gemmatimonadaceae bacterium]
MFKRSLVLVPLLLAGCATNPVTGKSEISLVSEQQEIQMGQQGAEQAKAAYGLVDDPALQQYVSSIGLEIAKKTERPDLPWAFYVIDDASVNAFALPGGPVFVTRGILGAMNNEGELASVLGHEIGHITARHSAQQMSQQQLAALGLGLGSILSPKVAELSGVIGQGLQLLFLKYSRDDESQADALGFRYMIQDNYDPRQMAAMFKTLDRETPAEGRLPAWLSTHPDPGNRYQIAMQRVDSLNRDLSGMKVDKADFLTHVNGLVYGENPREGFFKDGRFYHPDLKFQFQLPNGWQVQNTKQAVIAVSAQQDAMIQLSAGQGAPTAALQQFLGQQGIQAGQVSSSAINGLPAASGYFQAQTENGTLAGLVSYISYGGNTYQLLTYTPATQLDAYNATFQQVISSFAPLTDPAILNVQPKKVEVIKLPSRMTLAEFNSRYPSSIPVEELAIINGVETGTTLAAGTEVKRVR